ncbi:division plane positioning ATPase MipZ [Rhodospirillum rubrum]|uniref:ATPase n=1 Tax=Rhodospirillum rubrum (strain ATCC 11170 / ATH 1.1.1 / DSM 467 / LMG 4362 / NCIMB 8255 / S1) TaxID=269796 RepID=Q2RSH7_RHORT|nr:division plane positioning ATPase MipZ [Rhodospirillum rubrum]ABC22918.1 ATPase [Rhodospirillum rubrum ATCC 11170]AEO48642.1 ATPase [Rhodospirillum rubrum F11]MBK5954535.1 ATPase [Rhodospirillum rubrum]QXG78904.1 division plane positioning ATPase MipZ [Rhodospirillum rubrum]HAQ00659.1 ATPase [Rhodospirillum rubrum]
MGLEQDDEGGARRACVIVIGNQKGGSGKSTVAMHLVVSLARAGLRTGSIDLDAGQATLTRYLENRRAFAEKRGLDLPSPEHVPMVPGTSLEADIRRLEHSMLAFHEEVDVVVIDTPGSDTALNRAAHALADVLITPLNDSFIDLDVMARIDGDSMTITGPSPYAAAVWEAKQARARRDGTSMRWIVMRNRLSHLDARNKRDMEDALNDLSRRIGFSVVPGLGERVIYRELFLNGLTLLDLKDKGTGVDISMSHVAARQELRALLAAIGMPKSIGL